MPVSVVAALMILTTVILSACAQNEGRTMAVIEDKSGQYYGREPVMLAARNVTYQSASVDTILSTPITSAPVTPVAAMAPSFQNTAPVLTRSSAPAFTTTASNWTWPVKGKVTVPFGKQAEGFANEGITIAAADGAPITAAQGGEVAYVGNNVRDYGNMVIVRHSGGQLTSYAHAKEILVNKGDQVIQGDVLGYVGQSGSAKTPQLHFAMREGQGAIDPLRKLPSHVASR